jgi:transcriptional regulator with XRE-family HTH domain
MNPKILCEKIRALRKGPPKLATQGEMSEVLGVTQSTYQREESGQYPITIEELFLIAEKFNVDVSYFFDTMPIKKSGSPKAEELMDRIAMYQKMVDQLQTELNRCYEKLSYYEDRENPFQKNPKKNGSG